MNLNALPSLVPAAVNFTGAVTIPERRASAIAHGAALAAANPDHAEKITRTELANMHGGSRIAPRAPGPDMRSRLPRCERVGAKF